MTDLQTLYEREFDFVWRSLRRLGVPESDISDALQEVFIVAHRKLGEFEERARYSTWLFQIAYGVASTRRRRAHRRYEIIDPSLLDEQQADAKSPEDALSLRESMLLLDRALQTMSLEQRAVFVLFEIEEMTSEEIADTLGIPTGTVYSRLRLARAAFKRALAHLGAQSNGITRFATGTS